MTSLIHAMVEQGMSAMGPTFVYDQGFYILESDGWWAFPEDVFTEIVRENVPVPEIHDPVFLADLISALKHAASGYFELKNYTRTI